MLRIVSINYFLNDNVQIRELYNYVFGVLSTFIYNAWPGGVPVCMRCTQVTLLCFIADTLNYQKNQGRLSETWQQVRNLG